VNSADFHYVLGSVHPQLDEFRSRYWNEDPTEVQRTYFRLLADAAETNLFDCLAHPDLVKNATPNSWEPVHIMDDIRHALDRIAATGIAMELNTSGANKVIPEMHPFPAMLVEMRHRNIPVVVGADAHQPERVADRFEVAMELLVHSGDENVSIFLERKRHEIPIGTARESLIAPAHAG
jgi:histidinol-phosphatase (PHP family)